MVSLNRSVNMNSGGATFFSESVNVDDREHLHPTEETIGTFKPLQTAHLYSLQLLFTFILDILAIYYAVEHPDPKNKCREYFAIIYIHIGLWIFTLVVDRITHCAHHNLKLNGYLEFHKESQAHVALPLYIVSLWSVVLMFIQTLMQHFYPDDFAEKCLKGGALSPISYVCAFIVVESCVLAGVNVNYILKVRNFNKLKSPPDVLKDEWMPGTSPINAAEGEVGYKSPEGSALDLFEKQADLILHLQQNNERLSKKVIVLSAQVQQLRSTRATN
ncbi:unnamed protein product [Acanthoscelides obtectus]|uniref:Transmembrane protein 192 n=1 Tax=Acanthoscelides obtectus TaxID=200917 RepID=A0A9P0L6S2_ACAOB|nr:unnamed protein product [Acanthoscelides obtectus]CAK1674409.1 Transmembrane protein 192 [Acanthoscelides obtectus]